MFSLQFASNLMNNVFCVVESFTDQSDLRVLAKTVSRETNEIAPAKQIRIAAKYGSLWRERGSRDMHMNLRVVACAVDGCSDLGNVYFSGSSIPVASE